MLARVDMARAQAQLADDSPAVRDLRVTVPLRAPAGGAPPAALPPSLARALQDEYAIRYLARLGASACPANIAMVLEHLPLERCQLSAAWKARGALSDELSIDMFASGPAPVAPTSASAIKAATALQLEAPQHSPVADTGSFYCFGPICWSFEDIKRRFLPPFNASRTTHSPATADFEPLKEDSSFSGPEQQTAAQILVRKATLARQQCALERSEPPDVRHETVVAIHRAFFSALPLAALGLTSPSTRDRFDAAQQLLGALARDRNVLELVRCIVLLLYHDVFLPLTLATQPMSSSTRHGDLLVDTIRLFAALREQYTAVKAPTSLLSLLLLAIRVDVETIFRSQYPQSFSSTSTSIADDMQRVLLAMDARVSRLLDPDAHWSRFPILESSCAAGVARVAPAFQRQQRRSRLREQFFRTSEALHCVFPTPSSGTSRRIIAGGGARVAQFSGPRQDIEGENPPKDVVGRRVSVESKLKLLRMLQRR